jgi:hypothetical protein
LLQCQILANVTATVIKAVIAHVRINDGSST